jgi:hypothetical protein
MRYINTVCVWGHASHTDTHTLSLCVPLSLTRTHAPDLRVSLLRRSGRQHQQGRRRRRRRPRPRRSPLPLLPRPRRPRVPVRLQRQLAVCALEVPKAVAEDGAPHPGRESERRWKRTEKRREKRGEEEKRGGRRGKERSRVCYLHTRVFFVLTRFPPSGSRRTRSIRQISTPSVMFVKPSFDTRARAEDSR